MVAQHKKVNHETTILTLAPGTHELLEMLEEIDEYLDEQLQVGQDPRITVEAIKSDPAQAFRCI